MTRVCGTASLLLLALLVGCVSPPKPAPPTASGWYAINTDLGVKAEQHRAATVAMIDSNGLLCYSAYFPWGPSDGPLSNYLLSHDIADAPAWHGMLMQALALESAVSGRDNSALLGDMAGAFLTCFEVTGVEGLLARSWIPDYAGPRLDWQLDESARPTKYWVRGAGGAWYRNGLAKNHWNMAASGCGMALLLDRQGKITLHPDDRADLVRALVGLVSHLRDGGWRIKDPNLGFTEFGDLRPDVAFGPDWPEVGVLPNGFNRMLVLAALASASHYDAGLEALYEELAPEWGPGIGSSLEVVGEAVRAAGHHRLGKPSYSDMQAFSTAAIVFLLQEERREIRRHVTRGLHGLWEYVRYENNPAFSYAYSIGRPLDAKLPWVERLLRHFPGPEAKKPYAFVKRETSHYQPIENRPPNTNYWKSSPFRLAVSLDLNDVATNPVTGDPGRYAGADYLYAYWLGRYLGALPPN